MKEDKNIFLKVDSVEPVFKGGGNWPGEPYLDGIRVWIDGDGHFFECDQYTVCDPDVVREAGHREAFALMNKIYNMTGTERREAFGETFLGEIIKDASYDDLMKKLDEWKKKNKTIHVRDEVVNVGTGVKIVVTAPPEIGSNSFKYISGIAKNGKVYKDVVASAYKKTGVHVDDLDAYLEV